MMDFVDQAGGGFLSAMGMDAVDALRAFFVFAACTTLSVSLPASLRTRFVTYGARATTKPTTNESKPPPAQAAGSYATRTLDYLASVKVPHSYFTQFYIASVLSSIFWCTQLVFRGPAFRAVAARVNEEHLQKSMSLHQVILCWLLMTIQGSRRLYESFIFAKPSSSQMWFVHWLLGIAFYLGATIAVWIEGTGTIQSKDLTLDIVKITNVPTLRTMLCIPMFLLASGFQHDCHHYLFSLKKYSLPTHPLFSSVVCPHYTAECVIYLSLALLAAPQGEMVNKTLLSCLAFVAINLGITAGTSKQWYIQKFDEDSVRGRWNMIPGIY